VCEGSTWTREALDLRRFVGGTRPQEAVGILSRNDVDYVMVAKDSHLAEELGRLPGLAPGQTPGERYGLYHVGRQR
ncbi:MAG: hypothetical protein M3317_13090, partial [Actinomycetota bacterium]|nr:hypothetical protein [Actinomycetota bacterium]